MSLPLRALTIDLWNTLIFSSPEIEMRRVESRFAALTQTLTALGWDFDRERLEYAYEVCGEQHAHVQYTGQDLSAEAHVGLLLTLLDPQRAALLSLADRANIVEQYGRCALDAMPTAAPDAVATLAGLRERGLHLALISNTSRTPGRYLREVMAHLGLSAAFDVLVFSDEVEMAKPNRAIFAYALERLGVAADETAHVGDDIWLDCEGARQSGLHVIAVGPMRPPELAPTDWWISRFADLPQMLDSDPCR